MPPLFVTVSARKHALTVERASGRAGNIMFGVCAHEAGRTGSERKGGSARIYAHVAAVTLRRR